MVRFYREGGSTGKEAMEGRGLYKERDSTGKGAGQEQVIEDTCMHASYISQSIHFIEAYAGERYCPTITPNPNWGTNMTGAFG